MKWGLRRYAYTVASDKPADMSVGPILQTSGQCTHNPILQLESVAFRSDCEDVWGDLKLHRPHIS